MAYASLYDVISYEDGEVIEDTAAGEVAPGAEGEAAAEATASDAQTATDVAESTARDEELQEVAEKSDEAMGDLERIHEIVDGHEDELSETGAAVVTEAIAMAYRNLGISADVRRMYSPEAMTSSVSRTRVMRVAMEGVTDTLKKGWKAFVNFLKKIWETLKGWWAKFISLFTGKSNQLQKLKSAAESLKKEYKSLGAEKITNVEDFVKKYKEEEVTSVPIAKGAINDFKEIEFSAVEVLKETSEFIGKMGSGNIATIVNNLKTQITSTMNEEAFKKFDEAYQRGVEEANKLVEKFDNSTDYAAQYQVTPKSKEDGKTELSIEETQAWKDWSGKSKKVEFSLRNGTIASDLDSLIKFIDAGIKSGDVMERQLKVLVKAISQGTDVISSLNNVKDADYDKNANKALGMLRGFINTYCNPSRVSTYAKSVVQSAVSKTTSLAAASVKVWKKAIDGDELKDENTVKDEEKKDETKPANESYRSRRNYSESIFG